MVTRMTPKGYEMTLKTAWENFPTDDVEADTVRMNDVLAEAIRQSPAQYYWVHKRFKTRAEGQAPVYKNDAISR
jgi:KDO2-lipid IV(A) lauroyltransferase